MIKKFKIFLRKIIRDLMPVGSGFVPDKNDIMLVSYPKSGNTWVRALLCNLVKKDVPLQEMENIVPDIYANTLSKINDAFLFNGARIIKSHESFRPYYKRVIYIVRDPRDVMVSYYFFSKKRGYTGSLNNFCGDFLDGNIDNFGTWLQNYSSWLSSKEIDIIFIKYESLLSDTKLNLEKILSFIGFEASDEDIDRAIAACSLEKLREKEKKEGDNWKVMKGSSKDVSFFRSGTSGNWKDDEKDEVLRVYNTWFDFIDR